MIRSLLLALALAVAASVAGAADDWHYATKADAKAGRRTSGPPAASSPAREAEVGGEDCGTATPIVPPLPFNDSDDTTGNVNDVNTLPAQCSDYTQVNGPDLVYSFTVGPGNSVAFQVTPTNTVYDPAIYVLGTCGNGSTCVIGSDACVRQGFTPQPPGCLDGDADEDVPALTYALGTHAVYVDSFYAAGATCGGQGSVLCGTGPYTLTVTGTLPVELHRFEIE